MNFVGKFDAKLQIDGSGVDPDARLHVDSVSTSTHAPSGAIIVPDADLLFHGDFKRSGVDLILSRDDHELVVQDYFKGEKRAALASPDGAHLTGDIINALAGHVQYAQADGSAGAGKVIGHVTKLVGTATAIRNGVSIILNQGDNVEKGDVVQSGSGSTLGVTFIDGTVFGLSANARMVLNEMIYDPNGSDNSTLISLVAGTISFVAGQTAKHGDMKIDTPVATMGIRGTAVLVEIDFDVPGQNGVPDAKFQVLVEPDGTTGSYILYDKNTFAPLALVDKAGQRVDISSGNVSFSDSPLSPELQKLITDVFTLKFSNATPQTYTHFTDTLIPQTFPLAPFPNGVTPTALVLTVGAATLTGGPSSSPPSGPGNVPHINQPPVVTTVDSSLAERLHLTGNSAIDTTSGTINFADINLGDRPTAKATFSSFTYQNALHQDIAASARELADIQALEKIPLVVVQAPGNTYFGTATWTYNVPDKAFDFLGAGDTLTLTYMAEVDSNYSGGNLATLVPFTITVTGTNDAPVITTGAEKVAFVSVGTSTPGPNLPPTPAALTTNKLTFKDPDLTDTHTVSADLTAATLSTNGIPTLDMQALETKFPRPMGVFESALTAAVTTDSTGTGTGTITWTLADISAYYADIVPAGETLTLTYAVTVKDSQGATSSQKVVVTITGSDAPAVVWVETTADALTDSAPGDWNGAHNWETGTVPTLNDDVIIITNQLQGQTPFYPVTIEAGGDPAAAHSLTMNDFGTLFTNSPTLINKNTLTVGAGGISLSADAILENFGTLSVGGLAEILQQASLQNSGLITLAQGGDFKDQSTITNFGSGTIEVAGGTLNVEVAVANSGGVIQIDPGATLKLNGAAIDGGTINDNSKIDVTGSSKIDSGATLNNGAVTVEPGVTLTLDGMTVNATTITDKGTIVLDDTVQLTGGATIEGASSLLLGTITNNGTLEVTGAAELLDDTLTNSSGIIQIDALQTLTLSGTEIIGGTINDNSKIDVTGSSKIGSGATLNNGAVTVENGVTLTLDGMTVNGTTITDKGTIVLGDTVKLTGGATIEGVSSLLLGTITNNGTLEVAGAAELLNDTVTNTGATLQVDDGQTLKLNGTTINGGTINDFSSTAGGTIDVTGSSKIAGTSTATANLNGNGTGTVQLDAALTLDYVKLNGITIENGPLTIKDTVEVAGAVTLLNDTVTNTGATLQVDDGQTLTLSGTTINNGTINDLTPSGTGGTIDVTGDSKIDSGATLNNGAVTVESSVKLTLDNVTVNGTVFNDLVTGGTIQIDGGDALTFNGATINGGTLNISGELDSTGISFITGATIINSSHIDVVSGTLTIDPAPVTNIGTIEVKNDGTLVLSGEIITNTDGTTKGVIQVDADPTHTVATLDLEGSTINGGTLTIAGELVSTGDSFITGADITNTGTIDVTSGTLTIDATSILNNTGTLETNGGNLIIDTAFAGSLEIKGAAALELGSADAYSQVTVTFEPGATGTLELDHSKTFSGTVAGLDDNTIDLADVAYGSNPTVSYAGNASGGILSVFVGGVDVSNIHLTGDYLGVHWTLTDDGSSGHGTDVMEAPGAVAGLDPNGNAIQGAALTASITDGGQTVSGATYDWQVSYDGGNTWVDARGINGLSSYTPVEADEGQLLRVALSFTDYSGQPETSFVSAAVVQESLTGDLVATLDHTPAQQGVTMHVLGVKDGGITVTTGLTYAWQDSSDNGLTWVTVGNGTNSSYTPGESDEGKLMQLVVTYADASGSESSTYSLGMPNDLSATLDSTTAQQDLAIHVTGVNDGGTKVSSGVSYAWQVSSDNGKEWTTVGTHSDYTPTAAYAGDLLQVIVTYADSQEHESASYSLGSVAPAKEWLGGTHDWQTAGQWATSGAPVSSDNAVIDASGFYTVKIDEAAAAHSLVVNDLGAAVEILAGNTLTLGGNATIEAGILQIDSGATLKEIASSATITGAFIDNGTVEAAAGDTLEVASAISFGAGKFKIDAGATLQLDHADTLKVVFSGDGELILKDPTHFTGIISDGGGSLTSADVVDLAGFDSGASVSYFGLKSGGIVTISETGHTAVNLIVGANSTHWSAPVSDGHGGILIHDPPADSSGQALDSVVITDPGPAATSTIVAGGPNQILTGHAASDTFAFNFTGVGQTTVTDFDPATDTLQFNSQLFADIQAALNATHDDGHGNTVIALDAHDTITLNGILKAQLHASDFHFV